MLSRRSALLAALSSCVALPHRLWAQPLSVALGEKVEPVTILRVARRNIDVNGRAASTLGIRQPDGAQGLVTEVGRRFRVRVDNELDTPTLIHWHGLAPPWRQDGVPGISGPPISPGGSAEYDFPLRFGGTFWMHSHEGLQEQSLLAAPLIIREGRNPPGRQEATIMLADFSFTPAAQIYAELRRKHAMLGLRSGKTGAANATEVSRPSLNDVEYDAFLANDRTLADPETIRVEPGEPILLRVINSSCMSAYHVDLGALSGDLIAVDGCGVRPVTGQRFPIAVAQRLDILVKVPRSPGAFPILAILEGERRQSGVILVAGRAPVIRIPEKAPAPSTALTLELESRLRATTTLAQRLPDRIHRIDLTGDMNGYVWSINGVAWNREVPPLAVAEGERVEIVLNNKTLMSHPMHLHGHQFQVVEIDGKRFPGAMRDTVLVTPGSRVVFAFDANNPGWWAFHCHLLYHQAAGMFATVRYI